MSLQILAVRQDRQGLAAVERASTTIDGLTDLASAQPGVRGAVVLSTCNRVEIVLEVDDADAETVATFGERLDHWDTYRGEHALDHLFRVACGLESMVLGEREVAGQLRRALQAAQAEGHASLALTIAVEEALKASRKVANETQLDGAGRSVVGEALQLVGIERWAGTRVVLIGTGSYAGAVVAALRSRGVRDIAVHSASGRGADFAASHGIEEVADVHAAMRDADLVVTCRGRGTVIRPEHVRPGLKLVDLSLTRDVDRAVAEVEDVVVVDLETVQRAVEPRYDGDLAEAERLVAAGKQAALTKIRARVVDPAVTMLRQTVMQLVAEETERLPNRPLTREDAARALERLAVRLLHVPSARAREAAQLGRTNAYLVAMHELYGIESAPASDAVDAGQCPVTGLSVQDITHAKREVS